MKKIITLFSILLFSSSTFASQCSDMAERIIYDTYFVSDRGKSIYENKKHFCQEFKKIESEVKASDSNAEFTIPGVGDFGGGHEQSKEEITSIYKASCKNDKEYFSNKKFLKSTKRFVSDNGVKALEIVCGKEHAKTWEADIEYKESGSSFTMIVHPKFSAQDATVKKTGNPIINNLECNGPLVNLAINETVTQGMFITCNRLQKADANTKNMFNESGVLVPLSTAPLVGYLPPMLKPEKFTYLSDLKETIIVNPHGGLGKDKPYWQKEMRLNGKYFVKGLVMHPGDGKKDPSEVIVEYDIPSNSGFIDFTTKIGLLDPRCSSAGGSRGSVQFIVELDNVTKESRVIRMGDESDIKIRVVGAKKLTLKVNNLQDGGRCDHAVWADAAFTTF